MISTMNLYHKFAIVPILWWNDGRGDGLNRCPGQMWSQEGDKS
jgi:hypothetical protein